MRAGVSCIVAIGLVICTLQLVPWLYPDGSLASADPLLNPDKQLTVSDRYEVTTYQLWREVVVETTGMLLVKDGGRLVTERITLQGNAMFGVVGAVVEVSPTGHRTSASIWGTCSWFEVKDRSKVLVHGPDGGYDLPSSMGCSVGINVTASRHITIADSTLDLVAGDGLSAPEPLTAGDLDGNAFAGGDVELSLVSSSPYPSDLIHVVGADIRLSAGKGGDAPNAESLPPDSQGRLKGLGGGYTRGGDVKDRVGVGGDVTILIEAKAAVEVSGSNFNVTGGDGGDAGDGASVEAGVLAGAGGGGYTGGDGASGLAEEKVALPGGDVSGEVGRGGDIDVRVKAATMDLHEARFDMLGGAGGDAGDGGHSSGLGGGGGGGYTGGGGGSYWYMAGAPGGSVTGDVGRGGHVTVDVEAGDDMEVKGGHMWVLGGAGGASGAGGNGSVYGGGGGGGFTGGGGGGSGDTAGGEGQDGGPGGRVLGSVGRGGDASLSFGSDRFVCLHYWIDIEGGDGGPMGFPGATHILPNGDAAGGGGAGGHSAGGGGGAGPEGATGGAGGNASEVAGQVCDGGDVALDIQSERASIHRDLALYDVWGSRGITYVPGASGATGGRGSARDAFEGTVYEHIPMSMTMHYAPADEEFVPVPPKFDWMPCYRSTTSGDVDYYMFQMNNENVFDGELMFETTMDHPGWYKPDLPMGTYYWRVLTVYKGPPSIEGPEPLYFWFRYFNAPPVIMDEPTIRVDEGVRVSEYMGNHIYDPDTPLQALCLTCPHPGVEDIMGLFVSFYYPTYQPPHTIEYQVSDGVSTVTGVIHIVVIDANERPVIEDIDGEVQPVQFTVKSGEEVFWEIHAYDPNNDPLTYSVTGDFPRMNMSKLGTLHIHPTDEDLGMHAVSVTVSDDKGDSERWTVKFMVVNAQDPPDKPELFSPANGTVFKEGEEVTFTVRVSDPDIRYGQVLTVNWTSNVSGLIGSRGTVNWATVSTSRLPVGDHRVHITVSDGTYVSHGYVDVTIVERDEPAPPPERSDLWLYLVFALIFIAMIAIGYLAGSRGAKDEMAK